MKAKAKDPELKNAMLDRGYNVRELSEITGLSRSTIDRILEGKTTKPYNAKLISIALARRSSHLFDMISGKDDLNGIKR